MCKILQLPNQGKKLNANLKEYNKMVNDLTQSERAERMMEFIPRIRSFTLY